MEITPYYSQTKLQSPEWETWVAAKTPFQSKTNTIDFSFHPKVRIHLCQTIFHNFLKDLEFCSKSLCKSKISIKASDQNLQRSTVHPVVSQIASAYFKLATSKTKANQIKRCKFENLKPERKKKQKKQKQNKGFDSKNKTIQKNVIVRREKKLNISSSIEKTATRFTETKIIV